MGEQIQTNFGVRPLEHTLLMSSMSREAPRVADFTATEMYRQAITDPVWGSFGFICYFIH